MYNKTLKELSDDLKAKKYSSVELTQHYLDRIEKFDKDLNGFITVTKEQALEQAKKADEKIAQGENTVLTGLPIAHKDIFCTKGVKTTCGSKILSNFISPYTATAVERLENAGMVMVGKTNLDEFAMGSSNETSFYGPVKNPWNTKTVPGGSSGGSAAVVAARLAPIATGTDTGGSIRQPASLCGITGVKPTYGRVSRYGMIAYASSLDQGGPMGVSAEDCAYVLQTMAGLDENDSTSVDKEVSDYIGNLENNLQGLKVGLPKEYFNENLDADIAKLIENAIEAYKKLGVSFVEVSLANSEYAIPAYYVISPAECSSNLSRFDGVRYGHRTEEPENLEAMYKKSRGEGFGFEVKRRIMLGAYALSSGYYDAYYRKAQKIRRLVTQDFITAFEGVDLIAAPSSPNVAFGIGEKTDDPIAMYLNDIYTIPVNLAGLPAISFPVGFSKDLPVGLQLIAPHFEEAKMLNAAHQYQLVTDFHRQIPAMVKGE